MSADAGWRRAVEEHREVLEALADSGVDLQLVEDVRTLLDEADVENDHE